MNWAGITGLFVVILAILFVVFGYVVKWLWNSLCPELFGLPTITFWQSVGIQLLTGFLFKPSGLNQLIPKKEG